MKPNHTVRVVVAVAAVAWAGTAFGLPEAPKDERRIERRLRESDRATRPTMVVGVEDQDGDATPEILVEPNTENDLLLFSGATGERLATVPAESERALDLLDALLPGRGTVDGDFVVADLDADDLPDLVAGESDGGQLLVFSGSDGSFLYALVLSGGTATARASDLARTQATAPCVVRENFVQSGDWRTLATIWNASAIARFVGPAGASVKIRYGVGWFGWDSQKQTLDGFNLKQLSVSKTASVSRARIQIRVPASGWITWTYCGI
jgi:hypothetical protein